MGPKGSLVAFACEPRAVAAELPGERNGIFTKHLLQHIKTPGLEIQKLFIRVGNGVREETKSFPRGEQNPYVNSALRVEDASLC